MGSSVLVTLVVLLVLSAAPARAQTTTIRATDSVTGADVQAVGDATNKAIRVSQAGSWLVSGVVAVSQSGTWTVQPGNTANTTAWLVTGLGGTFPATQSGTWNITNISGTISLPTGAATESTLSTLNGKVTAVDTGNVTIAALPNEGQQTMANSVSVAIASNQSAVAVSGPLTDTQLRATAVPVDGSGVTQPVSGSVTANLGTLNGAATAANQTTGNTSLASIDGKITAVNTGAVVVSSSALPSLAATSTKQSDGSQKTQVVDGSGNVIGATSNALDINIKSGNPTTITATQATGSNLHVVVDTAPSTAVTNAGTFATQATLQTGSAQIGHLEANQSVNVAQINGVTPLMGNGATGTGSQRVTIASDNTAFAVNAQVTPVTSGGTSTCVLQSTASTNATNCKNGAGQIYGYDLINTTTTIYYLRLYNSSSGPTCSSATGFIRTIPVPPAAASGGAGGLVRDISNGEAYGTGIGFCLTGGGSSTDNTNAATGVYVTVHYK